MSPSPYTVTTSVAAVAAAELAGFPILHTELRRHQGRHQGRVVFHLDAAARPVIDRFFAAMEHACALKDRAAASTK